MMPYRKQQPKPDYPMLTKAAFSFAIVSLTIAQAFAAPSSNNNSNSSNSKDFTMNSNEQRSTLDDQQAVAVTIYNHDMALVKDQRHINLSNGLNVLALRDVSALIRPETAALRSLNDAGSLNVLEQNFNFDLLTPQSLLEKYVGQTVGLIKTNPATGAETTEQAQVLSASNGVVLKINDRIETGIPGRITFNSVPNNLRDRPTLVLQLNNKGSNNQNIELSYLTGGLGWKADYVAELGENDDKLDLSGWVTLTNTSGTSYRNAKLQLVAGDVNQVTEMRGNLSRIQPMMAMKSMDVAAPMQEEGLFEYHLYTLDRPTTISENQTKQVALMSASGIPVRKELLFNGSDYYYNGSYSDLGQKLKAAVFVSFDNKEASKLGMPLPKGIIRVYKKDKAGNAQFVGEDNIDHTPKNETIRLKLGDAFDVTADKKQTDFKQVSNNAHGNGTYESAYEVVLKNAKKERVTVIVREPIPADWKILKQNFDSEKVNSGTAEWKIDIPAESNTTLTYRVQVKY